MKSNIIHSFLALSLLVSPLAVSAQGTFDKNMIIADEQLVTYQTMTPTQIQQFLERKGGYIANYFFVPDDGTKKISAAQHIYDISVKHKVNPKFLLTMLQKEMSLVEEVTPKLTQLDWAMGYGCFDGQPCNERWRGFHKQVNSAAEQFRYYYENIDEYNFQPDKTSAVDSETVTPKNIVTAAMYNYTPHIHGNELFRSIWDKYFGQLLPDATLVQVEGEADVWLVMNGERRLFVNELALVTRYNPDLIISVTSADLTQYPRGLDFEFAAYSILRGTPSDKIYLITPTKKRHITTDEVFRNLGFNPEEIEEVSDTQLSKIRDGKDITLGDAYPTGAVLRDATDGDLFYVEAGRKYPIYSEEVVNINYATFSISEVASDVLKKYSSGFPIRINDGTIVKGSQPEVYVISNGLKRHVDSEEAFNAIGYDWANIVVVSDEVLSLHKTGVPLSVIL